MHQMSAIDTESAPFRLTPREIDVIRSIAKTAGSDREVAADVGLSPGSARVYVYHIRRKLECQGQAVSSRFELITWAKEYVKGLDEL